MPQTSSSNNGHKPASQPPASLRFERTAVKCGRCHRIFEHFMIEEIDELAQLRCGDVLLARAELACLHCGWVFYWNIREKDFEKMVIKYGQVLVNIGVYNPE